MNKKVWIRPNLGLVVGLCESLKMSYLQEEEPINVEYQNAKLGHREIIPMMEYPRFQTEGTQTSGIPYDILGLGSLMVM